MRIACLLSLFLCLSSHGLTCREVLWRVVTQTNFLLPSLPQNELDDNGSGVHIGILVRTFSRKLVWARGHVILNRHEQLIELVEKLHGPIEEVIWAGEMEYLNRHHRAHPGKLLTMNDTSGWWWATWKTKHSEAKNDVDLAFRLITEALPTLAPRNRPRLYSRERDSFLAEYPHIDDYMNQYSHNFRHDLYGNLIRPMWILEGLKLNKKADGDPIEVDSELREALESLEVAMQMLQLHHHGIPVEIKSKINRAKDHLFAIHLMTKDEHVNTIYLKVLLDQGESLYQIVQSIRRAEPSESDVLVLDSGT